MKGPSSVLWLAPFVLLASACAAARPPRMPAWSPEPASVSGAALVAAAAPRDIDDDKMRVPREEEVKTTWQAQGLYIGGSLITAQPLGDFDGDTALAGTTDLLLVPDLDVGAGASLYLSYRWHMNEFLAEYSITEHDGSFSGSPEDHDTSIHDFAFNWRHYFWEQSPLQPYGLLGFGWSRAEIDNGSTDQATGTVFEDAELQDGIVVNVGAGAALYTLPWVAFFGQGMYRFVRYETSDGIDGHLRNTPDIDGDGWCVSIGAALRLLPPRSR